MKKRGWRTSLNSDLSLRKPIGCTACTGAQTLSWSLSLGKIHAPFFAPPPWRQREKIFSHLTWAFASFRTSPSSPRRTRRTQTGFSASHTNRVLRVCKFSHLAELAQTHTNRVLRVAHNQGPPRLQVFAPRRARPLPRFGLFWGC